MIELFNCKKVTDKPLLIICSTKWLCNVCLKAFISVNSYNAKILWYSNITIVFLKLLVYIKSPKGSTNRFYSLP